MSPDRPPAFIWNKGAWFGAQLGGSAWMLVVAVHFFDTPWLGGVTLACFLAVNAVGMALWRRRDRMDVYPALQILLIVLALGGLVAIATVDFAGRLSSLWITGSPEMDAWFGARRWTAYAPLLIVPALMGLFAWRQRSAQPPPPA